MSKNNMTANYIVTAALIATLYAALTYISSIFGIAFGGIQLRLSEALYVLTLFNPAAITGLTVGCIIGNIASPFGLIDIILGSLATFLSALFVRMIGKFFKNKAVYLSPIAPVVFNSTIVGFEILLFAENGSSLMLFTISALQVAVGELIVTTALGIPLYFLLKNKIKVI